MQELQNTYNSYVDDARANHEKVQVLHQMIKHLNPIVGISNYNKDWAKNMYIPMLTEALECVKKCIRAYKRIIVLTYEQEFKPCSIGQQYAHHGQQEMFTIELELKKLMEEMNKLK